MELVSPWRLPTAQRWVLTSLILGLALQRSLVTACSGRMVYNDTSGNITDGYGNYPPSAHCEWLIDAGDHGRFISLEFHKMDTECSYDYLFIYNGNSYEDPLLGSFSGSTLPPIILGTSGYLLIYFYSDRNYVREGFNATYTVTECPYDCNGHGSCEPSTGVCTCSSGYTGSGCENEYCPALCGDHGQCQFADRQCLCDANYTGYACDIAVNSSVGQSTWYEVHPHGMAFDARTGHAGVYIAHWDSFFIFGGYTLNALLNDLMVFDFAQNNWISRTIASPWPSKRHDHTIVAVGHNFYMFGGILSDGSHSNELWYYEVSTNTWTLKATSSIISPPGLSSHTLTLVEDSALYLFGGRTADGDFSSQIFRYNVTTSSDEWEAIMPRGGREADRRLVGHSTVYHKESQSLLIFGGFLPDYARFPKRTSALHAYHIVTNYWSQIHYEGVDDSSLPRDRAFHSAVIMGNYMVIYGGNYHIHHEEEICYDDKLYFYHLGCHRWIDYAQILGAFPGHSNRTYPGRFSHVADVAYGNTLMIVGGYFGTVLGDFIAHIVPVAIAKSQTAVGSADHCPEYQVSENCTFDPECFWCSLDSVTLEAGCIHRSTASTCLDALEIDDERCPGICGWLHDCGSCTVQGQGAVLADSSIPELWHNEQCSWCVKESMCQKINLPVGACDPGTSTQSGLVAWWGANSSAPTSVDQCRLEDFPAGLHWIKYRHPPNWDRPDEVSIIRVTEGNFQFDALFDMENIERTKYTTKFRGFLYPLAADSSNGPPLKVYLVSVAAEAVVNISTDETIANQETVAQLAWGTYMNNIAERESGPIFPNEGRGYKYYMEQVAQQLVSGPATAQVASTIKLDWTGALQEPSRIMEKFSVEFLEPFNSEDCSGYDTCLACMTDTSCGWCPTNSTCEPKKDTSGSANQCGAVDGAHYLILNADECPVCVEHITCDACTQDSLCEWLSPEARCIRRGRFAEAVQVPEECPVPCQMRTNCTSCLSERNECAWCEETATCFAFVEYMMRYVYGGCMQWVDIMSEQECHDCSRHHGCDDCLADFQCGWCGNTENPTIGRCLHGDFTGADMPGNCSALISEVANISVSEPADWSYGSCPDVEECKFGLHDCHENATCENTPTSYTCTCNRGFTGNGKDTCNRTCYYDCLYGTCSGAPDYKCTCDIGWTGEECDIDCGCNNHSTCVSGVGQCDLCQHYTTGSDCSECSPGAYGNATSDLGCSPCECNGHGDESVGICNSSTGTCYCKDNTFGDYCDKCMAGFYGNPQNGARCYLQCAGRTILGNITDGALGSHIGAGVENMDHAYCLWILTIHPDLDKIGEGGDIPTITFTMQTDIKTECDHDYVYVYDGIPSFMTSSSTSTAMLLAAFCGLYGLSDTVSVEAKSGYITVFFEGNVAQSSSSTQGFNATYSVNVCPNGCNGNRECVANRCVCKNGYGGINCGQMLCPNNCSDHLGQGQCNLDRGQCDCSTGYGGVDCRQVIDDSTALYTVIYDPWRVDGIGAFNSTLARMGHSMVTCDGSTFYMFGGYSLNHGIHSDLWKYTVATETWTLVVTSDGPSARYLHAAVCVPVIHAIFVFGGLVDEIGAVREMWKYSIDGNIWRQLTITDPDPEYPIPAMAGHTMTRINDIAIMVIGGFSSQDYFSESVYKYDVSNNEWSEMEQTGAAPTGLFGHTSVFHNDDEGDGSVDAVYVFGGYQYQTDKTLISNSLYSMVMDGSSEVRWSLLPPEVGNKPAERYFHSAVSTEHYMFVLGGRTSQNDFDHTVMAYRYSCNEWINLTAGMDQVYGSGITPVIGGDAVAVLGSSAKDFIYFMAGFNGLTQGMIMKLEVPKDLCVLNTDKASCLSRLGCYACVDRDTNATVCGSNANYGYSCTLGDDLEIGTSCDVSRIEERDCNQHETCTECLAQWPAHGTHLRVCQWCSNCPTGKCIAKNENCETVNFCSRQQKSITSTDECVERLCQASDCASCLKKGTCIWTRQFKRSSEVGRTLSLIPIYDWNCVVKSLLDATPYPIQACPPESCPTRCHQYTTCQGCLESMGGEGGNQDCVWSTYLQECMPPAHLHLHCANGECGHILTGVSEQCPLPCSNNEQCSQCLSTPGCGWCAFGGLNGLGVCMEGGLMMPKTGVCSSENVTYGGGVPLSEEAGNWSSIATSDPTWAFAQCPAENECTNGHHTCDDSETCTNLDDGYRCECKKGYIRDSSTHKCRPDCRQRCEPHGNCVAPDVCDCHFGYVGDNCSTECLCNKHSNCESVTERDVCLACQNNTMGVQCSDCKSLFVGDPKDGGSCQSCNAFCNTHSDICVDEWEGEAIFLNPQLPQNVNWTNDGPGPSDPESARCIDCRGNTQGRRCESCKVGYFRLKDASLRLECQKCQCHGHSDICDVDSGTNCDCKNNTKSPRCESSADPTTPCYTQQCSECNDNFLGKPTNGHQCYRLMNVDRDYCLDPNTQMNCHSDPASLLLGRTVFFVVQPKYLNVDIRITLDITVGGVDLFFSPVDDTFAIEVEDNGFHTVTINPKYRYADISQEGGGISKRDITSRRHKRADSESPFGYSSRVRRSTNDTNEGNADKLYILEQQEANDFTSFITIMHPDTFLIVRGIENRLVITLPNGVHHLKSSRFYLVLQGTGNESLGNVFFRQDQPHIDLFVFFSVFFSSFFQFLATCVLIWKLKQGIDARRNRYRRQIEMEQRASRPFSQVNVLIEPNNGDDVPVSLLPRGKRSLPKPGSKYSLSGSMEPLNPEDRFGVTALAIEPTEEGVAAVGTFFFQLPGGPAAPIQSCLGSALIQSSRLYPISSSHHQQKMNIVHIRPRPSSSA